LSGQEPPGFAVQASKKKWIFKKSGFSKSRVFSRVNRKSTGGVTPGPMPKKAEVDYIFFQKAEGGPYSGNFLVLLFFLCHTVSQENHNVYSKPSIVLLRSGKLIRLSLYSPDIVVVSPGVSDCTPSWNQRVTEYCGV
jgi:hypothetical protein